MRGDQREGSGHTEMLHDGDAERSALFGIGGRAEFVQQHERIGRDVERHLADVGNVRGKGAEIFLDGLVVADIRQHLLEERKLGFQRRNRKARLRHQAEQSDGFQGDRFAAGVGTADQQRVAVFGEFQADRHRLVLTAPQHVLQQRMARFAQQQSVAEARERRNRTRLRTAPWRRSVPVPPWWPASAGWSRRGRAGGRSVPAGCDALPAPLLRKGAPARCSGRWFRGARQTACGRWSWPRESRRRACAAARRSAGTTKRSLRMVTNSSWRIPSSLCALRNRSRDS